MSVYRKSQWFSLLQRQKERLTDEPFLFPFVFFIAVGLCLVLLGVSQFTVNPHVGHPSVPLALVTPEQSLPKIWYGASLDGNNLIVTNAERKVFTIPMDAKDVKEAYALLSEDLEKNALKALRDSVVVGIAARDRFKVVLSVDQKLTFDHLKPLVQLLAAANLTRISFETRLIAQESESVKTQETESHETKVHH